MLAVLSLHASGVNLGEIGVRMDRRGGMGPGVPDGTQVNGMSNGTCFAVHMLKLQNLMVEEFGVEARNNDKISGISNLAEVLGSGNSAEND